MTSTPSKKAIALTKKTRKPSRIGKWSYQLRLLGMKPSTIPMERLGLYLQEFAGLIGAENQPIFNGLKDASVGMLALVPETRVHHVQTRLVLARQDPHSRPAKHAARIHDMVDADGVPGAEIRDRSDNVIYLFPRRDMQAATVLTIMQSSTIDGVVTGMVGADDTMHLHLRDWADRDIKIIVRDVGMARDLLAHFRKDIVRVTAEGTWKRTDMGWIPENNRCTAKSFDVLNEDPVDTIMERFVAVPGNGWKSMKDPMGFLRELRGDEA